MEIAEGIPVSDRPGKALPQLDQGRSDIGSSNVSQDCSCMLRISAQVRTKVNRSKGKHDVLTDLNSWMRLRCRVCSLRSTESHLESLKLVQNVDCLHWYAGRLHRLAWPDRTSACDPEMGATSAYHNTIIELLLR